MTFGISVPQNHEISSEKCNFEAQPKKILLWDTVFNTLCINYPSVYQLAHNLP